MSDDIQDVKDRVKVLVREKFDEKINNVIAESEQKDEEIEEEEKDTSKRSDDDDDEEDGDDEEDDEESDDDEEDDQVNEAFSVVANKSNNPRAKPETLEVRDMKELAKMARTGKYDFFTVHKRNGEEVEFMVEKGKLVEM